jgi:hypothetical protein
MPVALLFQLLSQEHTEPAAQSASVEHAYRQ